MSSEDTPIESIEVTPGKRPVVRLNKESNPTEESPATTDETSTRPSPASDEESDDTSLSLPSWLRKGVVETVAPTATDAAGSDVPTDSSEGKDVVDRSGENLESASVVEVASNETDDADGKTSVEANEVDVSSDIDGHSASSLNEMPEPGPTPVFVTNLTTGQTMSALGEWAKNWNVDDDPYVTGLVAALGRRDNMTMWASLDPMVMLPEPELRSGSFAKRIARVLTVIRNVLVFVPVALTWLSIQHATEAFGRFLRESNKAGQDISFLQFWQSPEGFLSDHWRIQDVARLDAIIILFIIAATLIANTLESRARALSASVGREIQKDRTRIGLMIAETLQGNKSASPESITESLALALNDLSQAARDVSLAAARMEAASVGIDSLNPRIENLNERITDLDQRFAGDVVKSVNSLVSSVSTLGVAMGGDMQKFVADVLAGLEEVNDGFKKTFVAVEFGTKQLRDDLDAIHRKLRP